MEDKFIFFEGWIYFTAKNCLIFHIIIREQGLAAQRLQHPEAEQQTFKMLHEKSHLVMATTQPIDASLVT